MGSDDRRDDADDEISAGDLIHMADDSSFRWNIIAILLLATVK